MPAHTTELHGVRAANNAGVSGPNKVTTRIGVRVAKCAGPLSFVTSTFASVYNTSNCRRVVLPANETQRGEPVRRANASAAADSPGAPVKPIQASGYFSINLLASST